MGFNFRKYFTGLSIIPKTPLTANAQGDLEVDSGSGKLNYHNGTTESPVVTEAHTATLTNKTISGASNTITGITAASINSGAATNGQALLANGSSGAAWGNVGTGMVTSVAMTVPTFLSVAGSPITTSGTLAVSLSGTALPVANGGTGATTLGSGGVLVGAGTSAITASSNLTFNASNSASALGINATGGTSGTPQVINFLNAASSGKYNFQIGNQIINNNEWAVIPSTLVDGATFSTPVFQITQAGVGKIGASLQIASSGPTLTYVGSGGTAGLGISTGNLYLNGNSGAGYFAAGSGGAGGLSSARTINIATSGTSTAFPAVVSAIPSTHGLIIVRGSFYYTGGVYTITVGEGFTLTHNSTGNHTITFTASTFTEIPAVTFNPNVVHVGVSTNGATCQKITESASAVGVVTVVGAVAAECGIDFIAIGQRGS